MLFVACNNSVKGKDGTVYKSAADYNDYIVTRQNKIIQNMMGLNNLGDDQLDSAMNIVDRNVGLIDKMIGELEAMPPYKKDSSMRDAAVNSIRAYSAPTIKGFCR